MIVHVTENTNREVTIGHTGRRKKKLRRIKPIYISKRGEKLTIYRGRNRETKKGDVERERGEEK